MRQRIILLSGQVCAGKTTLATLLSDRYGAFHIKTRECLRALNADIPNERSAMQAAGEALDVKTGGAWVRNALQKLSLIHI